ncbi:MAG TPA: c-type cytochrome [Acidimicrobiales bacterium]|nr:c-type cytochrome [Acidimicrobiales bacterium]
MRRGAAILSALIGLALGGCAYLGGEVEPYRPPAYYPPPGQARVDPVAVGRHLYLRDCAFCHGNDGQGTARAPSVIDATNGPALTDFMLRTGRMPVNAPRDPTTHSEPTYGEEEIRALVRYMEREFPTPGPDIPRVDPRGGDLSTGQQLYQAHCGACHATTGIGGAMLTQRGRESVGGTAGIIIPGFEHSDALEIAEAVRTGPGTMPVFTRSLISDEELDSVVRYVLYLKDPNDVGGAPLGHVGPVVEGAVGWLIGLGVLLVVIRWIGTKAGERP